MITQADESCISQRVGYDGAARVLAHIQLILELYLQNELAFRNTFFEMKQIHKSTREGGWQKIMWRTG